jgi:hypothetical protein
MIGRITRLMTVTALFVAAAFAPAAQAAEGASLQYKIKAGFLYNFTRFVEWPEEAFADDHSPICLCILGKDPFGDTLDAIQARTAQGRRVVINRSQKIEDLPKCHILFISKSEGKNVEKILAQVKGWNVLTVGDMEGFAKRGGIINFIMVEGRVRFEINTDASDRAGLKIRSKLLKLADIVSEEHRTASTKGGEIDAQIP